MWIFAQSVCRFLHSEDLEEMARFGCSSLWASSRLLPGASSQFWAPPLPKVILARPRILPENRALGLTCLQFGLEFVPSWTAFPFWLDIPLARSASLHFGSRALRVVLGWSYRAFGVGLELAASAGYCFTHRVREVVLRFSGRPLFLA